MDCGMPGGRFACQRGGERCFRVRGGSPGALSCCIAAKMIGLHSSLDDIDSLKGREEMCSRRRTGAHASDTRLTQRLACWMANGEHRHRLKHLTCEEYELASRLSVRVLRTWTYECTCVWPVVVFLASFCLWCCVLRSHQFATGDGWLASLYFTLLRFS